ncbi:division/cell wall cluster transcriptional repressor MraZ [Thalassobaculum sp.]|uniref:division/cell wall cluster transcriptional repressor MraZ n=1 Tax=Thalassobaculum sp. TaxID=2022740 RepID=UPI0032EF161C
MAVFLSTFANKIDKKGRVSVPATFRAALEQEKSTGLILYPSFKHPCIEGCGDERIEQIAESIDALDAFSEEAENLQTILADSIRLTVDGDGRVMMPKELIEFAEIDDTVVFVGQGKGFQIWKPATYETYRAEKRARARQSGATLRIVKNDDSGGGR